MTLIECKVTFDSLSEEGLIRRVNEIHVTDALTFTEAEKMVTEILKPLIHGSFGFKYMKQVYFDELTIENPAEETFFIAKINSISVNDAGTERRIPLKWLLTATDIDSAKAKVDEMIRGALGTFILSEIKESKIISFVSETDVTEEDNKQEEED